MIQETREIDRPGTTGRPGLAHGFVYLALIVILTHAAVLLMNQPAVAPLGQASHSAPSQTKVRAGTLAWMPSGTSGTLPFPLFIACSTAETCL